MTQRFKRFIKNSDTILTIVPLLVVVFIVIRYYILDFTGLYRSIASQYEENIGTGIFVTVFCLIPPFLVVFLPIKLKKWWEESEKW